MNRIIRVDMKKLTADIRDCPAEYRGIGGRLLTARILTDEVDPKCDPLGPGNKLIFSAGILGGTLAPCSERLSAGFKSPLTGTIKEANSGGTAMHNLLGLGYSTLIIEGKPESGSFILHVSKGGAELLDAAEYSGMLTYELTEKLIGRFGADAAVISIGPAGERGYLTASVQVTGVNKYPSRAAARGGPGAVMGSKGLKAIVIDGDGKEKPEYADQDLFKENNRIFISKIKEDPLSSQAMPALGTPVLVNAVNAFGALPVRNFSEGTWDKAQEISGENIAEIQPGRGGSLNHNCQPGCIIRCSNEYHGPDGKYLTSGLEYETIGLFGSNLLIDDIDAIAGLDRICDEIGVDTMDTACAIGMCMESGMIGFGDVEAAFSLLEDMKQGNERGFMLGLGAERVAKKLGVKRCPTVKGQSMAAYDPRALVGTGVTYATAAMGADHTCGNVIGMPGVEPCMTEGMVELSASRQTHMCVADTLGICIFSSFCAAYPETWPAIAKMLSGLFGDEWDVDRVLGLGKECRRLERAFNHAAGFTDADDRIPEFMLAEKLPPHGAVWSISAGELAAVHEM